MFWKKCTVDCKLSVGDYFAVRDLLFKYITEYCNPTFIFLQFILPMVNCM